MNIEPLKTILDLTENKQIVQNDLNKNLNPFLGEFQIADSNLISINNSLRNSLFFNRSSSKYSLELVNQLFANKNLLINGTDFKSTNKEQIKLRWNLNRKFMLNSQVNRELKKNSSTYMENRNFNLENREINSASL